MRLIDGEKVSMLKPQSMIQVDRYARVGAAPFPLPRRQTVLKLSEDSAHVGAIGLALEPLSWHWSHWPGCLSGSPVQLRDRRSGKAPRRTKRARANALEHSYYRFRAKSGRLQGFWRFSPESQRQNLALIVVYVPN